jgi:hypothetical protein
LRLSLGKFLVAPASIEKSKVGAMADPEVGDAVHNVQLVPGESQSTESQNEI